VRSIFFLWKLIIQLATLKGGDDGGTGNNTNDTNTNNNKDSWTTENFTNDVTGQKGTVSYDQNGNYSVSYDDNTGHGYSDGTNYSYGDENNDGIADATYVTETEVGITQENYYSDGTISIGSYDFESDSAISQTGTINNLGQYSWDVTIASEALFGGYNIDHYNTNFDGSLNPSDHHRNAGKWYGSSWDTHYFSQNNQEFGILAELYADMSELLGYKYSESFAQGVETVGAIIGIAYLGMGFKTSMGIAGFGQAIGSKTLTGIGYVSAFAHGYGIYSEMESLAGIYGGTSAYSIGVSSYGIGDGGQSRIQNIINASSEELKEEYRLQGQYYADVSTGMIFDKMAGGRLYQSVFAGDIYFDATKGPNTNFSVGESFSLSSHSLITNAPYSEFIPKNQAGTDRFSVVSV
jgi:hypothetical protein